MKTRLTRVMVLSHGMRPVSIVWMKDLGYWSVTSPACDLLTLFPNAFNGIAYTLEDAYETARMLVSPLVDWSEDVDVNWLQSQEPLALIGLYFEVTDDTSDTPFAIVKACYNCCVNPKYVDVEVPEIEVKESFFSLEGALGFCEFLSHKCNFFPVFSSENIDKEATLKR